MLVQEVKAPGAGGHEEASQEGSVESAISRSDTVGTSRRERVIG